MGDNVQITESTGGKFVATDETADTQLAATGVVNFQYVKLADGPPGNTTKAAVKTTAALPTDGALVVQQSPIGEVSEGSADSGAGNKISAKVHAGLSGDTMLAVNQRGDLACDVDRVLITRNQCPLEDLVKGRTALSGTTPAAVITAGGSGIKNYVTDVTIANSSATNVTVDLLDGTGGSSLWTFPVPANSGVVKTFSSPIPGSAATAVAAQTSATGATITVSLSGFRSKI